MFNSITNMLLTDTTDAGATPQTGSTWWIYVILIVLVVAMLVLPSITNRRRQKEYNTMLDQLRVGDEVRTIGGVIGKVTKINTKGDIKTFTLETGAKGSKTTMEFDMAAVGTVLKSTYKPPVEEPKEQEAVENKKEETAQAVSEPAEEVIENETMPEEKAKPAAKKPAAKKSTKK